MRMGCNCSDFDLPLEIVNSENGEFKATSLRVRPGIILYEFTFCPNGDLRIPLTLDQDSLCVGLIRKGKVNISSKKASKSSLQEGQWLLSRAKDIDFNAESKNSCDVILLSIDKETIHAFVKLAGDEFKESFSPFMCPFSKESTLIKGEAGKYLSSLGLQIHAQRAVHLMGRLELERDVIEWIRLLFGAPEFKVFSPERIGVSKQDIKKYQKIASYLEGHFCEEISLSQLAEDFGVCETKIKIQFKQLFSRTVFDYIRDLRFKYAEQLIRQNELSILEIAYEVGYSNPSHFSQGFKDRYGVLPKAYQMRHSS